MPGLTTELPALPSLLTCAWPALRRTVLTSVRSTKLT
ncbi:hypothetical protein BJY22_006266 [Kribbella shirazensis]|uniref:Uncharacterized protein n=1 Tax=Kribbella shirazensis TaxID=1105143 RepID=A0A7X5VG00_9ACTN|nr:hypothetical protein [Kribbella shirazensis]